MSTKKLALILTLAIIAFLANAGSTFVLYYYGGSYDGEVILNLTKW